MTTLLIVGAGPPQVPAYHAARRRELRVVALDGDPDAPGMSLAAAAHVVDVRDTEGVLAVAQRERIDGAITFCTDAAVRTTAAVCRALGLRGLTPEAAVRVTHRGSMRDALARAGAPVLRYRRTFDVEEAHAAAAELRLPVNIVPVSVATAQEARRVERFEELDAAYAHALSSSEGAREVLVEELLEGPELAVETLSYGGQHHIVALTDHSRSLDGGALVLGYAEPSRLPRLAQTQIKIAALAALDGLGIMDSAAHIEMRLTRKGPRIVSVELCLGGDGVAGELVSRATGIDLVEASLELALGLTPDMKRKRNGGAAVRYVCAKPGRVVAIRGIEQARAGEGIVRIELSVRPGDDLRPALAGVHRSGYVVAEGPDAAIAEARARAAAQKIWIETA